MSESLFWNQHLHNFSSSHPDALGWKVYELPGDRARKGHMNLLLDYLRDEAPHTIERRITIKELSREELGWSSSPNQYHAADPGTEWDLSKELDSTDWFGLVKLRWGGHSIHCLSLLLKRGYGYANIYHVATTSNVALRHLLAEVESYGKGKNPDNARSIHVINGEDIPIAPVSWEDIHLPPGLVEDIRDNVTSFFRSGDLYRSLGIPHRRGLLFTGPPGCGKTTSLKAVLWNSPASAMTVLGKADVDDADIERAFRLAKEQAPAIVVFEDLDKLVRSEKVSLAHFLNVLDGFSTLSGVMVIASSNEPELLDPALLHRPSRFDRVWTFPLPAREQRLALLRTRSRGYFSEPALQEVAEKSHGFSMAYVQEIVINALLISAHNRTTPSDSDLLGCLDTLRSQQRAVSRRLDSLSQPESVGFAVPNHAGSCSGRKEA